MSSKLHIHQLVVGPLSVNCYIVVCEETKNCVVIDPGEDGKRIEKKIKQLGAKLTHIINTHGHFDHIGANKYLKDRTGALIAIHVLDRVLMSHAEEHASIYGLSVNHSPQPDVTLNDKDTITCGELEFTVIHTPGHTQGGICLHIEDNLFSGDTLFEGSIGRTDLPGGNFNELIKSIKTRLSDLSEDTMVFPGHGGTTTLEREAKTNPFLNRFL
jgi:glyoxylase-like metal-dependent hydrolase (beta-lactamase superfamily II)